MTTMLEQRTAFSASEADSIAERAGLPRSAQRTGSSWTTRCVWYDDPGGLTAVVGSPEGRHVDIALAHGLANAAGRPLRLVLPLDWAHPTLQRLPWLNSDVQVWTHDAHGSVVSCEPRKKAAALDLAGGPEKSPEKHLGTAGEHIRPLLEWAARHEELAAGHRRDVRAWSHRGQRVLAITSTAASVRVRAGVDAAKSPALLLTLDRPMTTDELGTIQAAVLEGVEDARAKTHGSFEEHHLQEILRHRAHLLGLEHPVLREVPAWRPSGGPKPNGRGFLDLVGKDGLGDVVLVETKLAADDMLVLQGLDYWIWANRQENRAWLDQRLHAATGRSRLRLLYAVGGKDGSVPVLSAYAKVHFAALDETVEWSLALLRDWPTDMAVDMKPLRTV